jgi:lipoate-protein ligase B
MDYGVVADPPAELMEARRGGRTTLSAERAQVAGDPLQILWLGRVAYRDALERQLALQQARMRGEAPDTVLLLEHPDVITLGRGTRPESLLGSEEALRGLGYDVERVNRGGSVTYHGPGQLVGYPILDLAAHARARGREPDVHRYLRALENALIGTLVELGLDARGVAGRAGVWLGDGRKIASIGVGLRRWVTLHGFALNVSCALERFAPIVPCGLEGVQMTSVEAALGRPVSLEAVRESLMRALRGEFA